MKEFPGHTVPLTPERILICDLVHFGKQVPSIPVQRTMQLARLIEARKQAKSRPSWCILFVHAFARVAQQMPELRRCYMACPWERMYEHPVSVASVSVERVREGIPVIAFAKLREPERHQLPAMDRYLNYFARSTTKNMISASIALKISRLWRPFRLMIWWLILNVSGYWRSRAFGTFSVSVYSSLGAESLHPITPLPFVLNYGPIDEHGEVNVRIIYDHRVVDGATIARALAAIEKELTGPVVAQLQMEQA